MKPRYLLDTNICIFLKNNRHPAVARKLSTLMPGDIGAARLVGGVLDAEQSAVIFQQQTTNYTVTAADNGKDIWLYSSSPLTLTIPLQANAGFPAKMFFFVSRMGGGAVTLAPESGVNLCTAGGRLKLAETYTTVLLRKLWDNNWLVTGNLSA